jgi:predicted O-linked N-acetylglucosamine transferase (SPINDLY family)
MSRKAGLRRRQNAVKEGPALKAARLCRAAKLAIAQGNLDVAQEAYGAAIECGTRDPEAFNDLATIYDKKGVKAEERFQLLSKAFEMAPGHPVIRRNFLNLLQGLLVAFEQAGHFREALPLHLRRVALEPDSAPAQRALGYCYGQLGHSEAAVTHFTRATTLDPNNPGYHNDLGLAWLELHQLSQARAAFQRVLELNPRSVPAFVHLGLLANITGLTDVAVNMMHRALQVDPNCVEAHNNLAMFLRDQGELVECRRHYQQALRLKPNQASVFSGYLLSLNDDPAAEPDWVASEHRRFNEIVKSRSRPLAPRSLDPEKRLRIAYLSPDFRTHSVAHFIAPLLEAHDRLMVEVTCYATSNAEDGMTERIRQATDRWRPVFRLSDDDLAALIQEDQIDVLIELSGHTADNRLTMLAERTAPVQMTYLGYPNTTGLASVDYRITDAVADPPGVTDAWHTEKLLRIDGGFLAYAAPPFAKEIPVSDPPARKAGAITFGSFNNLAKTNDTLLQSWATILARVPHSRLLLKAHGLRNEGVRQRILRTFAAHGEIAPERVCFMGHERSAADHLQRYHEVDLALDTFPYNGTTTTCEALWMGVPVLTLQGRSHAGRVGASLLSRVALQEFVAQDWSDYVEKAVVWAGRQDNSGELRSKLRGRLLASPLMDAGRLARGLEAAFREAWRSYCRGRSSQGDAPTCRR